MAPKPQVPKPNHDDTVSLENRPTIRLRPAQGSDLSFVRAALWQSRMNPFSIRPENLIVAVEQTKTNDITDDDSCCILGFGQIRPLDASYSELASLYVKPNARKQGIGRRIVEELLHRHDDQQHHHGDTTQGNDGSAIISEPNNHSNGRVLLLLTLPTTVSFYTPYGFRVVSTSSAAPMRSLLPWSFQVEYAAGCLLQQMIIMFGKNNTSSSSSSSSSSNVSTTPNRSQGSPPVVVMMRDQQSPVTSSSTP